jgi:hypothetical protein
LKNNCWPAPEFPNPISTTLLESAISATYRA